MAALVWGCLLLAPVLSSSQPAAFHNSLQATAGAGAQGGFLLSGAGLLQDVLLLDSAEQFQVRLGSDGHLRVQPLTSCSPNLTWWQGRPLLGMKVRQLLSNGSVTERSVLARVKATQLLHENLLRVELDSDRIMDLMHSGVVHMQFSPPEHPPPPGLSGLGGLQAVPGLELAEPAVSLQSGSVRLAAWPHKEAVLEFEIAADDSCSSEALAVKMFEVKESHRIHPTVTAQTLYDAGTRRNCYTSRTVVEVDTSGTLELTAGSEVGVDKRVLVASRPSRLLHRLPLLLTPHLPPLTFVTSYSSATWLDIYFTTSGPLHFRGGFNATGNVVLEVFLCDGEPPRTTAHFSGWSAEVTPWSGHSHAPFSARVSMYSQVRYQSSLQWQGVPEATRSLPALVLSIKPTVTVRSTPTSGGECVHGDLSVTGELRQDDPQRQRGVDALTGSGSLTRPLLERALLHQCFLPAAQDSASSVAMETYCGVPSSSIGRDDLAFQRLQMVLGTEVEFRGEEAAAGWCGAPGQPCPPCYPPSPQMPCADRVMAPTAALLLSHLAQLARLRWPQWRLMVEDAWTEPDEKHPLGRHGNQSLYYEGRALRLTLVSRSDMSYLQELAELAVSAGFSFAGVRSSAVEVCVAPSLQHARPRRSLPPLTSSVYRGHFDTVMQGIDPETLTETFCPRTVPVGQSSPPGRTLDQVLGPPYDPGSRMEELEQYIHDDAEFPDVGSQGCPTSDSEVAAAWCQHRAMTPRAVLRLHRMAALVRQKVQEIEKENALSQIPDWLTALRQSTQIAVEHLSYETPEESDPSQRVKRKAINPEYFQFSTFWANGKVYYEFHHSVDETQQSEIKKAIAEWEKYTCLKFEEDILAPSKMTFQYNVNPSYGCRSHLGHLKNPIDKSDGLHQTVHFITDCFVFGTIVHEIGHTIGFFHEHQRPDAPKYIELADDVKDNDQYKPAQEKYVNTFGVPYDYLSIMHYPNFSITTKDPYFQDKIGQRLGLSFLDIKLANLMYNCSGHCSESKRKACSGVRQYLDRDCNCWCSPPPGKLFPQRVLCPSVKVLDTETSARGTILELSLPSDSPVDGDQFSALARQAGFDYILRPSAQSLQVYARRQEGYRARLVEYQSSSLLAVLPPSQDYDLAETPASASPDTADLETEEFPPLLDGHNRSLPLSAHYRVGDFAHPDHRFLRLDPVLLDCLELGAEELGAPPRVEAGWGYRPASVNRVNLAARPSQEREAFQQGRAVILTPPTNRNGQNDLENMALTLMTKCTPLLLRINRKAGFGCHSDRLYLDVRTKTAEDVDQGRYAEVWDVDNPALYRRLAQAVQDMARGGPVIAPTSESRACREPFLGTQWAYFSFSTSLICIDFFNPCEASLQARTEVASNLTASVDAVLGRVVSTAAVSEAVTDCLVSPCGGCLGAGDTWKNKVRACVKLVKLFSEHATSPWGNTQDRGALVNPHHPQSSLHALACQQGSLCVENTQLYSLALPALHARYRPDPDESREELLYSGEDNPSPLLEAVHQEMASSLKGKVKVYIEREADLGVLKDTLKVLMVHNVWVTEVEFHFPDQKIQDRVLPRLQRHLEGWALRACPKWSRFSVAPFSAHVISPSRQRRSAELSRQRNEARQALLSWEKEWLLRI